jgi:hypothetical protein
MQEPDVFGCVAYHDDDSREMYRLDKIPDEYALRIDLRYKVGQPTVLIYTEMPSQEERMALMWKLQRVSSTTGKFVVYVIENGEEIECPPIP